MLKRRESVATSAGAAPDCGTNGSATRSTADCVLMYAQRGLGKTLELLQRLHLRLLDDEGELLPVGKAYFGFTDEELKWLDRFDPKPYGPPLRAGA